MTVYEKYGEDWVDIVLQDDDKPFGGVAFQGETLRDFCDDEDYFDPVTTPIEELNEVLAACGIRPV